MVMGWVETGGFGQPVRKGRGTLILSALHKPAIRWPNGHTSCEYHQQDGLSLYLIDRLGMALPLAPRRGA